MPNNQGRRKPATLLRTHSRHLLWFSAAIAGAPTTRRRFFFTKAFVRATQEPTERFAVDDERVQDIGQRLSSRESSPMSSDSKAELAWESLRRAEEALDTYLRGPDYDYQRHKELSEAVSEARNKLLAQISDVWSKT
jgi:hypothetical protein